MQFRCKRTPPWGSPRRALHRDGVGHTNPTSTPSASPTPASSSPTPASSSVAVVHLWPKVSTPSRSSRRFLSVLPFPCMFGCHPHQIPISLPLSVRRHHDRLSFSSRSSPVCGPHRLPVLRCRPARPPLSISTR
jgi:hypothetical protein